MVMVKKAFSVHGMCVGFEVMMKTLKVGVSLVV